MPAGFDPAKAANPTERHILKQADLMDRRYRERIQNQIDSINRILKGGTYTDEMLELHEVLAKQGAALKRIRQLLTEYANHDDADEWDAAEQGSLLAADILEELDASAED